jgi:hypothetical protein
MPVHDPIATSRRCEGKRDDGFLGGAAPDVSSARGVEEQRRAAIQPDRQFSAVRGGGDRVAGLAVIWWAPPTKGSYSLRLTVRPPGRSRGADIVPGDPIAPQLEACVGLRWIRGGGLIV